MQNHYSIHHSLGHLILHTDADTDTVKQVLVEYQARYPEERSCTSLRHFMNDEKHIPCELVAPVILYTRDVRPSIE